jgi:hypothetical protein
VENRSERQIVEGYLREYVKDENNSNVVRRWGVDANVDGDGVLSFTPISSGNTVQAHGAQAEQDSPADRQPTFTAPDLTRGRSSTDSMEMEVLNNSGGASG